MEIIAEARFAFLKILLGLFQSLSLVLKNKRRYVVTVKHSHIHPVY